MQTFNLPDNFLLLAQICLRSAPIISVCVEHTYVYKSTYMWVVLWRTEDICCYSCIVHLAFANSVSHCSGVPWWGFTGWPSNYMDPADATSSSLGLHAFKAWLICLGTELGSSCLHSKHLNKRVYHLPNPINQYFTLIAVLFKATILFWLLFIISFSFMIFSFCSLLFYWFHSWLQFFELPQHSCFKVFDRCDWTAWVIRFDQHQHPILFLVKYFLDNLWTYFFLWNWPYVTISL